jgi:basic membrane protein A and related proteins
MLLRSIVCVIPQLPAIIFWMRRRWQGERISPSNPVTRNRYTQRFRRRIFLWVPIGFLLFTSLSVSCSRDETDVVATPTRSSNFKVAMVLPGPKDDGSWSQSAYEGLKLIETELGAKIAYTENAGKLSEDRITDVIQKYAQDGYKFVIGHGGEFLEAIEEVAPNFPRTKFSVTTNCPGNNVNQGCLSFRGEELGYLSGAIAALKTKTGKIGFIGGEEYPHMKARAILFERGAKSMKPDIEVQVDWVGSWDKPKPAIAIAKKQVDAGVDVISISAEPAEEAVYALAQEWGIYLMGWQLDRYKLAPDRVITSAIQDVPKLMLQGAVLVQKGRWEGKQYKFGITEGVQELAPFRDSLTPAEETIIKKITEDILTDKIDTHL